MLHLGLAILGCLVLRRRGDDLPLWYLIALAAGMGASVFFLVIMLAHRHWCPSCAAAHAALLAQGLMTWRMTSLRPLHARRPVWLLAICTAALAVNAVFHHRTPAPELGPGDRLLGWLAAGADGQRIAQPVIAEPAPETALAVSTSGPATPATRSAERSAEAAMPTSPMPSTSPSQASTEAASAALQQHAPFRTTGFSRWGNAAAPITVRYHLSLVCPTCRAHWADIERIRPLIARGEIQIDILPTWPLRPHTHHGAQLGAHVLLAAGLDGEDQLLAAAGLLFSADGFQLLNVLDRVLGEDAAQHQGKVTDAMQREALVRLFAFIEPVAPRAVAASRSTSRSSTAISCPASPGSPSTRSSTRPGTTSSPPGPTGPGTLL